MDRDQYSRIKPGRWMTAAAALIAAIGASGIAHAQEWYAGVGVGQSKAKDFTVCEDLAIIFDPGLSCSADDTSTGWKVLFGRQFNKNAAAEFGYVDLGKASVTGSGTIFGIPAIIGGDWEVKGFNADFVGILPASNDWAVFGKIGIFSWDVDLKGIGGSESKSGADLTYGIGVKYDISNTVGLRAEWERFQDVGDENVTGQSDVDLYSVGVIFKFR